MKTSPMTWSIYSFFIVVSEILSHPEWMNRPADFLYARNVVIEKNRIGERVHQWESSIFSFRVANRVIDQRPSIDSYWPPKYADKSNLSNSFSLKENHVHTPFFRKRVVSMKTLSFWITQNAISYSLYILKNFDDSALIDCGHETGNK